MSDLEKEELSKQLFGSYHPSVKAFKKALEK